MNPAAVRTLTDQNRPSVAQAAVTFARGATLGRYVVLDVLGQGGMGCVYSAWDFALERRVALKVLTSAPSDRALLREAQAMARVTHVGINAIYDVGAFNGAPFLAMELADGGSLATWLKEAERPRRKILELLLQAGRGLAAAHDAGIAHGDFKPHNILLGKDGGARVSDFGLATAGPVAADAAQSGTPPYMAPEGGISALADQFSFAVTLYEALCGRRPFAGSTVDQVRACIALGPPSTEALKPSWLRRAVLRALSVSPADRFPSMTALLDALEPRRHHVRHNVAIGLGLGLVLIAAGYVRGRTVDSPSLCAGADEALQSVWSPERQAQLQSGLAQAPHGNDAWRGVRSELDGWAARWKGAYVSACEATHLRQTQSEAVLDLRMRCLSAQVHDVDALLVSLPAHASEAISAAQALRAFGACEDGPHLRQWRPHHAEAALSPALRTQLGRLRTQFFTGQYRQAFADGEALAVDARAAGDDYVLAETQMLRGEALWRSGPSKTEALPTLDEAVLAAERTGDETVGVSAQVVLSAVYTTAGQLDASASSLAHARGLLTRMGGNARLDLKIRTETAWQFVGVDDAKAVVLAEDALALATRSLPEDDLALIRAFASCGSAHLHAGEYALAVKPLEEALRKTERVLGPSSPTLVQALSPLSIALLEVGREEEGLVMARRAKALVTVSAAAENFQVSYVMLGLANALMVNGLFTEARAEFERVAQLEGDTLNAATAWLSTGESLRSEGRPLDALAAYRKAGAFLSRKAPGHPYRVAVIIGVAEAQLQAGQGTAGLASAREALALCEKAIQCGPLRAVALTSLGLAQLQTHALAPAKRTLEEALRLSDDAAPADLARIQFALAQVWAASGDRGKALALAQRAVPALEKRKDYALTYGQLKSFLATL